MSGSEDTDPIALQIRDSAKRTLFPHEKREIGRGTHECGDGLDGGAPRNG